MRKLSTILFFLWMSMAVSASATTYYIAANGSDSNSGTSKSTPWLHAPGMTGCTGKCASYSSAAGDQIILRGGDTWHFSSSVGTVGIPWNFSWGGTSGSPIYVGVDQTWYAGSAWTRPVLNGDNPLSTSAVSSCKYDESSLAFVNLSATNITFDNFEFTGGCWRGTQNGYSSYTGMSYITRYVDASQNPINITVENVYMHGWTHVTFSCGSGGTSGNCDGGQGIDGDSHSNGGQGNIVQNIVVDGSDSDSTSFSALYGDCYTFNNNIIRYVSNGPICNNMHQFYGNLIEYVSESSDGQTHSNGFEFNSEWPGTNYVYNNVIRHITAAVTGWVNPSQTDYHFNNVVWDTIGQNWDVDPTGGGTNMYFYNNTIVGGGVGASGAWEGVLNNNIFINGGTTGTPKSTTNSTNWTTAQATSAGYTSANNYAPTSSNCNGTSPCPATSGANLTTTCSAAGSALCSDTTLAVGYNTSNHTVIIPGRTASARPSSGNWASGAFQTATGSAPPAPTSVSAVAN
jgi:hypothetical protein